MAGDDIGLQASCFFELLRGIEQVPICASRSLINLSDMSDHSGDSSFVIALAWL